jgi:isopropylmalate/homocitrate/citramalate synthase
MRDRSNQPPVLLDNTLRESEQVPGVAFDEDVRRRILENLTAAGIDFVDLGLPGSEEQWGDVASMHDSLPPSVRGGVSVRASEADLRAAHAHGVESVFLLFPCSEVHLEHKFGWTREELTRRIATALHFAARRGLSAYVVAEDSSRGSEDLRRRFTRICAGEGASAIFLCDTVGTMVPARVAEWIDPCLEAGDGLPVGVHCHNDFGMATANTVQAYGEGAQLLSCTLNGLGERAGNADTLQVAAALSKLLAVEADWNLRRLADASRQLERQSGIPLPVQAPLVGWTAFRHESGIHVDGMLKHNLAYEPLDPDELGAERAYVLGTTSGRAHIRHILQAWSVPASEQLVDYLFASIREMAADRANSEHGHIDLLYEALRRRSLEDEDLLALVNGSRRRARA